MALVKTGSARKPPQLSDIFDFADNSLGDDRLLNQFVYIMGTDEFFLYAKQIDKIRIDFETRTQALRTSLQPQSDNLLDNCLSTQSVLDRNKLRIRFILTVQVLISMATGGLTYYFYGNRHISTSLLVALGIIIAITTAVVTAGVCSAISSASGPLMRQLQQKEDLYRQIWETQVAELVRTSVTEVFKTIGIMTFPIKAPTLVELTTAKIVPSGTQKTIVEFIGNHQSSAIGIAGPRGSGKSTLMQAIRDSAFASHTVLVPAPVKYEPIDFTRRLFIDVATEILSKAAYSMDQTGRTQRRRIQSARTARATFTAGIILTITSLISATVVKSIWDWYWPEIAGATSVVGLITVFCAGSVLVGAYLRPRQLRASPSRKFSPSVHLAAEALDVLTWDTEEGTAEKSTLKMFGSLLEVGGEDSITRSRREMSLPGLVEEFRKLLYSFSAEKVDNRFVIFIDELDKIAETDELITVINGLKDLLHIPGVHFVVSVSLEALRRFEERGVPARDAFDSAFDVVVPASLLTLDESCKVLDARVAAFPPVLAFYCHAWSGGLPRELLRIARNCIEAQRRSEDVLHISEVIRKVVSADLDTHLNNAFSDNDGKNESRLNVRTLFRMRDMVRDLGAGASPLEPLVQFKNGDFPQCALTSVLAVGVSLLACMPTDASDPEWWETPTSSIRAKIEAVAGARAAMSGPTALREEAVAQAVDLVSAKP
jgi:hypothetical protein